MKYLKKIILNNFRCYSQREFTFSQGLNIILGNNASGKTSLMEAIYMIGMCKSYRTNSDFEALLYNKEYYSIFSIVNNNDKEEKIALLWSGGNKKVSKDGSQYKTLSKHLGYLNVVVFSPDDLKLVNGDPKYKRRFLDINISQINPNYLKLLSDYNKILKEKNELLKNINYDGTNLSFNNESLIKVYNNLLVNKGKEIIKIRKEFLDDLNNYIYKAVREITSDKEITRINYIPNVSELDIENEYNKRFKNDLFAQTSTCGPHRDDFEVSINNQSAEGYASQGQCRTASLAIKIALAKKILDIGKDVIVILDDVFGELDESRQEKLIKAINSGNQIFITTTSLKYLSNETVEKSNLIKL